MLYGGRQASLQCLDEAGLLFQCSPQFLNLVLLPSDLFLEAQQLFAGADGLTEPWGGNQQDGAESDAAPRLPKARPAG